MIVTIQSLSSTGKGVATINHDQHNRAVFVAGGVPGDVLDITITNEHKIYYEATINKIITPSPNRTTPTCPHFGTCGACDYLHVTYEEQLAQKEQQVKHYLKQTDITTIPCPQPLHYRDKVRVQHQNGTIGFYAKKSNIVIPIQHCDLIREELNSAFTETAQEDREKRYAYDHETKSVISEDEDKLCTYHVAGMKITYSPKSFVQNNLLMNEQLIHVITTNAKGPRILDLYAGNGNLTLPLAKKARVVAVEASKTGYELLKKNIATNHIKTITAVRADADEYPAKGYDTVIIDPPRTGAKNIERIDADTIIYVSCNPRQLAKDLKKLNNHDLISITLLDLFPQTTHIEVVAVLQRRTPPSL